MATITRVRRVANPRRKRRLTPKQVKFFGTARQKAALKRRRSSARKSASGVRNPALVVTLGALNPQRRTTTMAATKRRRRKNTSGARRRRRIIRRISAAAPVRRRRVRNQSHRRRRIGAVRRRRNPTMFGSRPFSTEGAQMVLGGLLGVAGTKFIARMIPGNMMGFAGTFGPVITNAVGALVVGWAATKAARGPFGDAVLFGGMMQVGSVLVNSLVPNLRLADIPLALSGRGMGEFVPGQFAVPQNPVRGLPAPPPPVPANARVNMSGLHRAFGTAF